jgi:hypothetical protein
VKEFLTAVFALTIVSTSYAVGALPGFFLYYFKEKYHNNFQADIIILLIPFLLYIGLYFVEDRQAFYVPFAIFVIGISVSIYFTLSYYLVAINGHHLAVACLIGVVIACWTFFPEGKMRIT